MDRLERYLFASMIAVSLAMIVFGMIEIARAEPPPTPNRVRDGAQNYCTTWAKQAVVGVKNFLQNTPEMRVKNLTVVFQTPAEDKADPVNHRHMVINGEDVPTVLVLLSGAYDNGMPWELTEENKAWIADTLRGGWRWAQHEPDKLGPTERAVMHALYDHCLDQKEVQIDHTFHLPMVVSVESGNGYTLETEEDPYEWEYSLHRIASNQNLHLQAPAADPQYTRRDICMVKAMTGDDVLGRRASGQPIESLRAELDAEKMTGPQRAQQTELLEAAYAWKGTRSDFVHQVYSDCMQP